MRGFIITPNAINVTHELYRMQTYYLDTLSNCVFECMTHTDGRHALLIETDEPIRVKDGYVNEFTDLFTEYTEQEAASVSALIAGGSFTFGQVIPASLTIRDEDYMVNDGWFGDV